MEDVVRNAASRLKESEQRLAQERNRLAVTLRSIGDGVITTDTEGKVTTLNDVATILANAGTLIIVPGYGMAAAQAQHATRELADYLGEQGSISATPSTPLPVACRAT